MRLSRSELRGSRLGAALILLTMVCGLSSTANGQAGGVPTVIFRFDPTYQAVVAAPGGEDAEDDVQWARRRAEDLTEFYASQGERLLRLLSDYSGVSWPYDEIDVYVVRYFPTLSIQYPLTLAVGSIRQGESRQDIPSGDFLILTFAHQITHHLLDPPPDELDSERPAELRHPLMEEGNYRRESLVNLVAYRALGDLLGEDRLRKVVGEPLWISYNPEAAFLDSLETRWRLSASRPLVSWLDSEPEEGELVDLAERLESARSGREGAADDGAHAEPGPLSGSDFGFDLGQNAEGQLFIAFLDPRSPADRAGLRAGDVVLTLEGRRFTTGADAMRAARVAWEASGEVNVSVDRQGKEVFFQVH